MSIQREDVVNCYRYILGRAPESKSVVDEHIKTCHSIDDLRMKFLTSDEFGRTFCHIANKPQDIPMQVFDFASPPMEIEDCTDSELENIFQRIQKEWKKFGKENPFWSVLTHDQYKNENINEETKAQFYESGKIEAKAIVATLNRNGFLSDGNVHGGGTDGLKNCTVIEYGCGCGRVTKTLATIFKKVIALDISDGNLDVARREVKSSNVEFRLIENMHDYESLPKADVVYSRIVLQHNCPPVMEYLLNSMFRVLSDDGMAFFQIPTYKYGYKFSYDLYVNEKEHMEMHAFPQSKIFKIANRNFCFPCEVFQDNWIGEWGISTSFVFKKAGRPNQLP